MKNIKFRYYSEDTKEMIYGKKAFGILNETIQHNLIIGNTMQYTGLKDKNGKEIYESDLVNFTNEWDEEDTGWIEYREDEMSFVIATKETYCLISECPRDMTLEVIGNIFENKELLK